MTKSDGAILRELGADFLRIGLRTGTRAMAAGLKTVAEDAAGVVDEARGRLGRFIEGCDRIAGEAAEMGPKRRRGSPRP